ncbi:MAG: hypothetical protein NVS3B10_10490 [Polyangiales bacterium]
MSNRIASSSLAFAVVFATLAVVGVERPARAEDHPGVRVGIAVAPAAFGLFGVGTDGHYRSSNTAFGGRIGAMVAASRHFQVGIDATVLAPYGGEVVYSAAQLAGRGALSFGDDFELGLTARFGPGLARVDAGLASSKSTVPYSPGPAVDYLGWQGGLALDATWWTSRTFALVFAVEAIVGSESSRAGSDVYLGYLATTVGPAAIAPWLGVQVAL